MSIHVKIVLVAILSIALASCYYETPTTRYMDIGRADRKNITTRHPVSYYAQSYPQEEAVFDIVEETLEDYSSGDETKPYVHSRHCKIVVLDSAYGKRYDRFSLAYQEWRSVSDFLMLVRDPDGRMHEYTMDQLKKTTTKDGTRHYQCMYPQLKKGSIIEQFVETSSKSAIGGQLMTISQPLYCDSLHIFIACDKKKELRWKRTIQDVDYKLTKIPSKSKITEVYEYAESNVKPVYSEEYSEPRLNTTRYIQPRYTDEVKSWWQPNLEQFHDYYSKRMPRPVDLTNDTLVTLAMNLTKNCPTPKQALDSVLLWVQNNIRIDESNYTDGNENYNDVVRDKFGSASIVNGLTQTLLKIANIPSEYLIFRNRGYGLFDTHFLQRYEFTGMALQVPVEPDSNFIVFPTYKCIPYNEFPWWLENRAIVISRNIDSTRFITVNHPNKLFDNRSSKYSININSDSSAVVKVDFSCSGTYAHFFRRQVKDAAKFTDREVRDAMLDNCCLPWTFDDATREKATTSNENLDNPHQPFVVHVQFTIPNFFAVTNIEKRTNPIGRLLNYDYSLDSALYNGARHGKLYSMYPQDYFTKLELTISDAWRHTAMSDRRNAESELGSTMVDVDAQSGGFTITRREILKGGTFDPSLFKNLYNQLSPFSPINEVKAELIKRR